MFAFTSCFRNESLSGRNNNFSHPKRRKHTRVDAHYQCVYEISSAFVTLDKTFNEVEKMIVTAQKIKKMSVLLFPSPHHFYLRQTPLQPCLTPAFAFMKFRKFSMFVWNRVRFAVRHTS